MSKKNQRKSYDCKFRHYRGVDTSGEVEARGGATVAYRKLEGGDGFVAAISYCREYDNFRKNYGRDKAQGLLDQNKYTGYTKDDVCQATGLPRFLHVEGEDEKAFLSQLDEELYDNTGYMPR